MAFDKAIKPKRDQDYSGGPKPDPETVHTTDPQEHMKGPVSSVMQKIKDGADENEKEDHKKSEEEQKSGQAKIEEKKVNQ
jgi:hypothetical protein